MECPHAITVYTAESDVTVCQSCKEEMPDVDNFDYSQATRFGSPVHQHDIDNIPAEFLQTDPDLAAMGMSGKQQEKHYANVVKQARSCGKKQEGYVSHYKIPRPVDAAMKKIDPDYWKDKKNLERWSDWRVQ